MFLISPCSYPFPFHWSQVLSREWRCSWSSADRQYSNCICVINKFSAYWSVAYIRSLTLEKYRQCAGRSLMGYITREIQLNGKVIMRKTLLFIIPLLHQRWIGVYWIHPDVCLSVRPSVCRQGFRNILKKPLAQLISYLAFTLMWWVSWPLYVFVFLASFSALWWPNIWPNLGFWNFLKKWLARFSVFLKNSYLCSTQLQDRNCYWIFLDEVGSDQSGGYIVPIYGHSLLVI